MREERVVLNRDRRSDAVAQLLRIAVGVDADASVILVDEVGLVGVLRRVEEVVERRCLAEGEAAPLDEGAQQIGVAVASPTWAAAAVPPVIATWVPGRLSVGESLLV